MRAITICGIVPTPPFTFTLTMWQSSCSPDCNVSHALRREKGSPARLDGGLESVVLPEFQPLLSYPNSERTSISRHGSTRAQGMCSRDLSRIGAYSPHCLSSLPLFLQSRYPVPHVSQSRFRLCRKRKCIALCPSWRTERLPPSHLRHSEQRVLLDSPPSTQCRVQGTGSLRHLRTGNPPQIFHSLTLESGLHNPEPIYGAGCSVEMTLQQQQQHQQEEQPSPLAQSAILPCNELDRTNGKPGDSKTSRRCVVVTATRLVSTESFLIFLGSHQVCQHGGSVASTPRQGGRTNVDAHHFCASRSGCIPRASRGERQSQQGLL